MNAQPALSREPIAYEEMRRILGLINLAMPFPDRDPLYSGIERGVDWCVYSSPLGSLNGYARIPDGMEINVEELDVHGGITYGSGVCTGWVGFDTAHGGDVWDLDELRGAVGLYISAAGVEYHRFESEMAETFPRMARRWTVETILAECTSLAGQIAERRR